MKFRITNTQSAQMDTFYSPVKAKRPKQPS
jgi:hypothetical protein